MVATFEVEEWLARFPRHCNEVRNGHKGMHRTLNSLIRCFCSTRDSRECKCQTQLPSVLHAQPVQYRRFHCFRRTSRIDKGYTSA